MAKLRAVYYINQFYAGMGGEEMADTGLHILNEKKGPALGIEPMWNGEMEVVKVLVCGDNFINTDAKFEEILPTIKKEIEESFLKQIQLFHMDTGQDTDESAVLSSPLYRRIVENTKIISEFQELEESQVSVYKVFLYSNDLEMLARISKKLEKNKKLAVASSFKTNLEITAVEAQKGPVLKQYIESLGYTMDEVMVLGDSLNDYSMLSMDFGATVAMENAMPQVKTVSKYITKSNEEFGVAYAIYGVLAQIRKENAGWMSEA